MAYLYPVISWPGVLSPVSVSYTAGHGISPASANLVINPQAAEVATAGDLVIGDGVRAVRLRDCILVEQRESYSPAGRYVTLTIRDRRHRWVGGRISGKYNQLDERGKLKPWLVRSPTELAILCLKEMGEKKYQLRLPKGLSSKDIPKLERLLRTGENFPQTMTNPPVVWDNLPPMLALQRLASQYGCRVVWDPVTDMVGVGPIGAGTGLPAGGLSVQSDSAALSREVVPCGVGVLGAPVRHQIRIWVEAVGEEWDGSLVPIEQLSYAPDPGKSQQQVVVKAGSFAPATPATVTIDGVTFTQSGITAAAAMEGLADQITAAFGTAGMPNLAAAEASGDTLTITGLTALDLFGVETGGGVVAELKKAPANGPGDWRFCAPPLFASVRPTDRLSYDQARERAMRSVFKYYRVTVERPAWDATGPKTFQLPGQVVGPAKPKGVDAAGKPRPEKAVKYGRTVRRHQIVLLDTKVEQVVPEPRLLDGAVEQVRRLGVTLPFGGVLPEYYDGFSRDRAATVAGTYSRDCVSGVTWNTPPPDTPFARRFNRDRDRLFVPFSVDATRQMVAFADYVYMSVGRFPGAVGCAPARLVLETSALFEDADTGAVRRSEFYRPLGGPDPPDWQIREDVQAHIVGTYARNLDETDVRFAGDAEAESGGGDGVPKADKLVGGRWVDFGDGAKRAVYYLDGMAAGYQLKASQQRVYNAVALVSLTGKVQQVSWSAGVGGIATTAGLNTEFAWNVAPYPDRRLAENLAADESAAARNQLESPAGLAVATALRSGVRF